MDIKSRKEIAKQLGSVLKTEENVELLVKYFLPVYTPGVDPVEGSVADIFGKIKTDDMTAEYIAEEFRAIVKAKSFIVGSASELKKAIRGELDEPTEAQKKEAKAKQAKKFK